MARLEAIIDGSADGLATAASRAIGILEGLQKAADKLNIDLFKATTVDDINSVGTALTAVTGRMNDYINAALKGNSVWRDQQAAKTLDSLAARLRVVTGNAEAFGRTLALDRQELRAYQQAFDALMKVGIEPTDKRVQDLVANINRLNSAIQATVAGQKNPFAQFDDAAGLIGNLENRLKRLRTALRDAVDDRHIISLNRRLRETQDELYRLRNLGAESLGPLGKLEEEADRLRRSMRFAGTEADLKRIGAEIRKVEGEISRLTQVAGVMNYRFGRDGRQSFNQFGLELGRVIQDLPYASRAFGAVSDNFGAIGNNITRMAELFPGYVAQLRATVEASGRAATSTNLLNEAFRGLTRGAGAWLLGISLLVSGIQVYTALKQKAERETRAAADAIDREREALDRFIASQDAATRAAAGASSEISREITLLRTLYQVATNANVPMERRRDAVKGLNQEFKEYFKSLQDEAILTGNAAAAYRQLTRDLLATGRARAAMRMQAEGYEEIVRLEIQVTKNAERRQQLTESISRDMQRLAESTGRTFDPSNTTSILDFQRVLRQLNARDYPENEKLLDRIIKSNRELQTINESGVKIFARRQELLKDQNTLQDIVNASVAEGGKLIELNKEKTEKGTAAARDYAEAIRSLVERSSGREAVTGLEGLDKEVASVMVEYQKMYADLDALERKIASDSKLTAADRIKYITELERARAQLGIDEASRLSEAEISFAEKTSAKLEELYNRAGLTRIRSREQELAADKAFWDAQERNMVRFGISAEQLAELRKASEARINADWDARMFETSLLYQRRFNETAIQLETRRINEEYKAKEKELNRWIATQRAAGEETIAIERAVQAERLRLQEELFARYEDLYRRQRELQIQTAFDGDAMSVPLARINDQITELRRNFRGLTEEEITQFQQKISDLEAQREVLQLFQSTIDGVAGSFGNLFSDALFESDKVLDNLSKAFQNLAKNVVSSLAKIAVRYLINQAIGQASMKATTALGLTTAKALATAYAAPAALASTMSFGTAAAVGGAALTAVINQTRALALRGFSSGGYTGNVGKDQIAGVVHGQEFVVNARATRENLPLLRAINAGLDVSGSVTPVSFKSASFGNNMTLDIRVHGEFDGKNLKLVQDAAEREYNRYFGR